MQKAKANNNSVTLRLATLAFIIMSTRILSLNGDAICVWQLKFLSQWASACVLRSETSCPAKLSNQKLCFCTASLVERTRLAVHKQSFLNLLRQNGRRVTKVYKRFQLRMIPPANQILWHCSDSQSALRTKSSSRLCIRPKFSGTT